MDVTDADMASLRAIVAGEVRAHLARQRISGRQAAVRLGWTAPYLSRRLTGEIPFNVADLEAIAHLLGIPVTSFFGANSSHTDILPFRTPGRTSHAWVYPAAVAAAAMPGGVAAL